MSKTASVVIGANYGDEGKGLTTDWLVGSRYSDSNCLVVRHNGGAQAGHTVVTPDGRRHVHSQFGSGTLAGATTFLASTFLLDPKAFIDEREQLIKLNRSGPPVVSVDPSAQLVTPYDVVLNRFAEWRRRDTNSAHGSCGMGINETVVRGLTGHAITVHDIFSYNLTHIKSRLKAIQRQHLPTRLAWLGIELKQEDLDALEGDCAGWIEDIMTLTGYVTPTDIRRAAKNRHVIFEGAQGLMLCQSRVQDMPHLTRSYTGLRNIPPLADALGITELDIHYVTRTYLTRHGAGPLPGEGQDPGAWVIDPTNVPGPFQGTLRAAPINVPAMLEGAIQDAHKIAQHWRREPTFVVTHADALHDAGTLDTLFGFIPDANKIVSRGPTRETMEWRVPADRARVYG